MTTHNEHIVRSRAPVRIDFAGGWTDVAPFATEVGGAVVNAAINRYTYCSLIRQTGSEVKISSADFELFVEAKDFRELEYDGNLDLVKAAIRRLGIDFGMEVITRCDAPPGSGVGSSASIGVALIGLLNHFQKEKLSAHEMAELAHRLETEELNIRGGKQDQYASAVGGITYQEFEAGKVAISRLPLSDGTICELEKHLVLCYTGKSRLSGDIIAKVMGSYRDGVSEVANALHQIKDIAQQVKNSLLNGDLGRFGELLSQNWENQKKLDPSVTKPFIDQLFRIALDNGAIGGKALGAGGGGCLLFYCQGDQEGQVCKELQTAGADIIDFNFDFKGLQTWEV